MKTSYLLIMALIITSQVFAITGDQSDSDAKDQKIAEFHDLDDFSDLQTAFNADKGNVRFIALLSASCGYCIKGYRYMRKILEEVSDERLKMYVVWEPMLSGDTRALSEKMSSKGTDPRIVYQAWDPEWITGEKWKTVMQRDRGEEFAEDYSTPAWDVYFLYNEDVEWKQNEPTAPDYWQHQGAGISALTLNYDRLKAKVVELLQNID